MMKHTSPSVSIPAISFLMLAATATAAPDEVRSSLALDSSLFSGQPQAEPTAPITEKAFGEQNTWWWSVGAGGSFIGDGDGDVNLNFQFHYFFLEDVELGIEFSGSFFNQDQDKRPGADDTFGAGFTLNFRWHFINARRFSVFAEGGAGAQITADEVPDGGSEFNFTPRGGMGITWQIFENNPMRLMFGARWQHISNAGTQGDGRNPGRDTGMVYLSVLFPF